MCSVKVLVDRIDDTVFDQFYRIIFQVSFTYFRILNRHELAEQVQRNSECTQVCKQTICGS